MFKVGDKLIPKFEEKETRAIVTEVTCSGIVVSYKDGSTDSFRFDNIYLYFHDSVIREND